MQSGAVSRELTPDYAAALRVDLKTKWENCPFGLQIFLVTGDERAANKGANDFGSTLTMARLGFAVCHYFKYQRESHQRRANVSQIFEKSSMQSSFRCNALCSLASHNQKRQTRFYEFFQTPESCKGTSLCAAPLFERFRIAATRLL
jgi:hypothetical protein